MAAGGARVPSKRVLAAVWLFLCCGITYHATTRGGVVDAPPPLSDGADAVRRPGTHLVPSRGDGGGVGAGGLTPAPPKEEGGAPEGRVGAPWVEPPPFAPPPSVVLHPPKGPLSSFAEQSRLAEKLLVLCQNYCFPRKSREADTYTPPRPAFCHAADQFKGASFEFAQRPRDVAVPKVVPLVLCALGRRFYGPGGQSYVLEAIRQWRLFHSLQQSPIFLIIDDALMDDGNIRTVASEHHVELITSQSLLTPQWRRFFDIFYIQGYMHPGGTRTTGNTQFNQLVSERFLAIHALMQRRGLEHAVHLENDNMVYANMIPHVAAAVRCGYRLATTIPSTKGFVPGVMYIRDAAAIGQLCDFINDLLSCGPRFGRKLQKGYANDMTYLRNYFEYFGAAHLAALPSWEHQPGEHCMVDQVSRAGPALFDAASFGQWLSFARLAKRPSPPAHIRDSMRGRFLDATPPPEVRWHADAEGRRVPMWKNYSLLSLHIHAKNLDEFRSR